VEKIQSRIEASVEKDGKLDGVLVKDLITINGIRVQFEDDSWLLVRASSNTPNLVILAESFDEDGSRLRELDSTLRDLVEGIEDIGEFDPLYAT